MAHIGILCPPIPGHLNPVATLGRALARRGHKTTAFQLEEARSAIEAQQLEFQPLGEARAETRAIADAVAQLGTLTGLRAIRFTVQCATALARTTCHFGPDAIGRASVELLVVDQNEPAGACVAQHLELPFVNVLSGLPLNREPGVPPPFAPWAYSRGLPTRMLNTAAYAVFDRLIAPVNRVINEYRHTWGLPAVGRPDDTFSDLAQLSQLTEDFDFPRVSKPAALHYLGPFRDARRPRVAFPYERLNGKAIVYASMGTLATRQRQIFRTIAAACAGLDVQLIISMGGAPPIDASQLAGSPLVVQYAPQLELLQRAAVCITHGGLNTVMECLSYGVPMVAIPITNDQPAVCARVKRVHAGEVLPPARLSESKVRAAVQRVLGNKQYRESARCLEVSIAKAGGVTRAADIVEGILSGLRPQPAA